MSDEYTILLQDEDIIISATDGVLDNLFLMEILQIVKDYKLKYPRLYCKEQATELAQIIVKESLEKVNDKKKNTPYSKKYKKAYNAIWKGGKEDDITALVTFVVINN